MDIFAHGLWTNIVFYKKYATEKTQRLIAVLFGVLPDLISFTPATLYVLLTRQDFSPELFFSEKWVFTFAAASYDFTHSIVIFLAAVIIVAIIRKGKLYWPMWGWALHILIDIPTHKDFYETPFLFPFSDYKFGSGVDWAEPGFMVINYGALVLIYLFWFLVLRKNKAKN